MPFAVPTLTVYSKIGGRTEKLRLIYNVENYFSLVSVYFCHCGIGRFPLLEDISFFSLSGSDRSIMLKVCNQGSFNWNCTCSSFLYIISKFMRMVFPGSKWKNNNKYHHRINYIHILLNAHYALETNKFLLFQNIILFK
jgi:hypothetical protein